MQVCTFQCAHMHVFDLCARVCKRIFITIFVVVYYSVMCLSLKFYKDLVFRCGDIGLNTSLHVLMCTHAGFCFVCARMYTYLYQNFCVGPLLCYEFKFQISYRSNLPLQRYLQNWAMLLFLASTVYLSASTATFFQNSYHTEVME